MFILPNICVTILAAELPLSFEGTINYNQSVYRVRDIHAEPAGLESTSLVIAYGLGKHPSASILCVIYTARMSWSSQCGGFPIWKKHGIDDRNSLHNQDQSLKQTFEKVHSWKNSSCDDAVLITKWNALTHPGGQLNVVALDVQLGNL